MLQNNSEFFGGVRGFVFAALIYVSFLKQGYSLVAGVGHDPTTSGLYPFGCK